MGREFDNVTFCRRQHDEDLAFAMGDEIGVIEMAFAFWGAPLAEGQEPGQAAIGGAGWGEGEEARAVAQIEAAADYEADADCLRRVMRAHDAGKAVPSGDRVRGVAKPR